MKYLEKSIVQWHKETFPNATIQAIIDKLNEELHEAIDCLNDGNLQQMLEEVADVFIVACALAGRKQIFEENFSMYRVISDKMAINRGRAWGVELPNGDRPRIK